MHSWQHRTLVTLAIAGCLGSCAGTPPPPPTPPVETKPAAAAPSPAPATPVRLTPDADFRKQPPTPGPEPVLSLPQVKRFKLGSGLEVALIEAHLLPIVDLDMVVKTGGAANPKGLGGLADLTANMLDEGTKTRNTMQVADEVAQLGANLRTGASWDASQVSLACLSKNIDKAIEIWADVLLHPSFDDKDFARERDKLVTAMTSRKDNSTAVGMITMNRVLYPQDHPFARPQSGTEESVKKITVADMKKFHDAYYRPNNSILVVAGDIGEADLKAKLENLLKDWKPKKVAPPKLASVPPLAKTKVYLVDKAGAPQSSIRVALVGIERTSPDYFAATLTNLILGGSQHRLDLNLRENKGWTYAANSRFDMRRTPGPFSASGEFVAAHTAEAIAEILKEIRLLRDSDVTDDELRKAKDQIIKSFPARFTTLGSITDQIGDLALYGLPDDYLATFTTRIEAVGKADIRAVAQKYLQPDKLAVVVVGDQKTNEEALRKIADVELRDPDGKPIEAPKAPATGKPPG